MKIDKHLNLVIPIYGDEVPKLDEKGVAVLDANKKPVMVQPVRAYVHSTPLSREVFEKHFMVIARTFTAIYGGGLGQFGGPPIAMLLLKSVAEQQNAWEGDDGVRLGLVEEIRRTTTVMLPGEQGKGWQPVPLGVAVNRGAIDADDKSEVENAIVFFIVVSAMHKRAERRAILESVVDLWGAQISLLNSTDFAASLSTSTATANSGAKTPAGVTGKPAVGVDAVVDGKPASLAV